MAVTLNGTGCCPSSQEERRNDISEEGDDRL